MDCWRRGEGGGEEEEEEGRGVSMKEEKRGHFLESYKYKGAWVVEKYSTFVRLSFDFFFNYMGLIFILQLILYKI